MRYVWLFFLGLVAAMVVVLPRLSHPAGPGGAGLSKGPTEHPSSLVVVRNIPTIGPAALADSVVAFGLAQRGTPYVYAGTSPLTGFDCSGFIMYTFAHFKVAVPHSTALLIDVGQPVARPDAQPGDIVVFTGTAATSTTPGHAGIVVSERGEVPLRFVHSSSARRESGVKVSHVEGTDYERRFLQVRRVLGVAAPAVATAKAESAPRGGGGAPVALPVRPVAVKPAAVYVALPPTLQPKKMPTTTSKKKTFPVPRKKLYKKPAPKPKSSSAAPQPGRLKAQARPKHAAPSKGPQKTHATHHR